MFVLMIGLLFTLCIVTIYIYFTTASRIRLEYLFPFSRWEEPPAAYFDSETKAKYSESEDGVFVGQQRQAHSSKQDSQNLYSYIDFFNDSTTFVKNAVLDAVASLSDRCPYVTEVSWAVNTKLPSQIRGQHQALSILSNVIANWEFQRKNGLSEPLVLAFTGPTGVGKSETAYRLADAMFATASKVKGRSSSSKRYIPNGLLVLRGEDYSPSAKILRDSGVGGVGEVHNHIRGIIAQHLRKCNGNALVVFEEVQKVAVGVLESLLPGLEKGGSFMSIGEKDVPTFKRQQQQQSYMDTITSQISSLCSLVLGARPKYELLSTANVVFVFISDAASDAMIQLLLSHGNNRTAVPLSAMRYRVKSALDQQWERLRFGKVINDVIPFLPLEKSHIEDIFALKLREMAELYRHVYWLDLVVDSAVVTTLSGAPYVKYSNHTVVISHLLTAAAAGVDVGRGDKQEEERDRDTAGVPVTNEQRMKETRSAQFAAYGARGIENAGPLQDLRGALYTRMRPWRSLSVLHVGLTGSWRKEEADEMKGHSSSSRKRSKIIREQVERLSEKHWGMTGIEDGLVYLQWCSPAAITIAHPNQQQQQQQQQQRQSLKTGHCAAANSEEDLPISSCSADAAAAATEGDNTDSIHYEEEILGDPKINPSEAFSELCETMWIGKLTS